MSRSISPLTESADLVYRRRVYTIIIGAATLTLLFTPLVTPHRDTYQLYLSPPLLALGFYDLWWLYTKKPLHIAENVGYATLAVVAVAHLAILTFFPTPPSLYPNDGPYWILICGLTIGFLAFPAPRAWRLNLLLTAICLILPWLAHSSYAFQNIGAFLRMQCAVVVMLLLLGTLAALRRQVDAKEQAEQAMRVLAFTDSLTALPNRRAVYPAVEELIQASHRGSAGTLHLIDIDHFKKINDQHGHSVGDEVLIAVARLIATCDTVSGNASPTVGRWGGEEFIVVMPGTGRALSEERGKTLLEEFRRAVWPEGLNITVSVGSSTVRPGDTFSSLLRRADQALYLAKETGRNRIMFDS